MNMLSHRFSKYLATTTCAVVLAMTASLSFAQTEAETLSQLKTQLTAIPYPLTQAYSETETTWDDDESTKTIALFNTPAQPYWKLVSVNDQTPSKKQNKKFKKKVEKQIEDREKDPFTSILNLTSLVLLETKNDMTIYAFNPVFSAFNEEAPELMTGRVLVNLDNKITRIEIDAPVEFSPVFGAKIKKFMINYNVDYHEQTPYITDYELDINIKIGGFKTMALKANALYHDIQW